MASCSVNPSIPVYGFIPLSRLFSLIATIRLAYMIASRFVISSAERLTILPRRFFFLNIFSSCCVNISFAYPDAPAFVTIALMILLTFLGLGTKSFMTLFMSFCLSNSDLLSLLSIGPLPLFVSLTFLSDFFLRSLMSIFGSTGPSSFCFLIEGS